jgi:hypothetical protein
VVQLTRVGRHRRPDKGPVVSRRLP